MTLEQIKQAISEGKRVFQHNERYEVIHCRKAGYLIGWDIGGHQENWIGLTWQDGITMNGKPEDFFIG